MVEHLRRRVEPARRRAVAGEIGAHGGGLKSTRSRSSADRARMRAVRRMSEAACQLLAMIRCRSPRRSARSSMSKRIGASPTRIASRWRAIRRSGCVVGHDWRRSRLRWLISPGSPSPSMKSTPSSWSAAASLRSVAPSYGLNGLRIVGSRRRPSVGEGVQRSGVTLQGDRLLAWRDRVELLVLAVKRGHVEHRSEERCELCWCCAHGSTAVVRCRGVWHASAGVPRFRRRHRHARVGRPGRVGEEAAASRYPSWTRGACCRRRCRAESLIGMEHLVGGRFDAAVEVMSGE